MTAAELLHRLRALGVKLWTDGDRLRFDAPRGALTPELREDLVRRKAEVMALVGAPIPRRGTPGDGRGLPLSFAQARLWYVDSFGERGPAYHIATAARVSGKLDASALAWSFDALVERHEVLRTVFRVVEGTPEQVILAAPERVVEVEDLSALSAEERAREAARRTAEEAAKPFSLSEGPLVRVRLVRLGASEHLVLFTMHHIVADGWSMGVLIEEVTELYAARTEGRPPKLRPLPIQYADYALWQRERMERGALAGEVAYWKQQLAGLKALELSTDRPRPAVPSARGAAMAFTLPEPLRRALVALGQQEGATLFMVLLAGFVLLLRRYTGQDDIAVGSPIASRTRSELEGLIGFFVNTVVLRTRLEGELTVREVIRRVRESALGAYAHQEVPFERLVEELEPERSLSQAPLLEVMFSLQTAGRAASTLGELKLDLVGAEHRTAKFDLTLSMVDGPDGLGGAVEYSTDLFEAATIQRMLTHAERVLEAMAANADQRISALAILTDAELARVEAWNRTERAWRAPSVVALIEAQAAARPEALAVMGPVGEQLSYGALNQWANRVAQALRERGVGPDVAVGVWLERSMALPVAMVSVLKAGGAYVPLDPSLPRERLAYMARDAGVTVIVSERRLRDRMDAVSPWSEAEIVCLEDWQSAGAAAVETNPTHDGSAETLAYVMYTSGSTGTPRGVMVPRGGLGSLAQELKERFGLGPEQRVLLFASPSFDASVWEMLMALTVGASLHPVAADVVLSGEAFVRFIEERQITAATLPPSYVDALPEADLASLRLLVVAGEACPPGVVRRWGRGRRLVNAYGPTEATICAGMHDTNAEDEHEGVRVPIGLPIGNVQMYVLDRDLSIVPAGVRGELYLGGAGLARGYFNRPDWTAERFIPSPLRPGERLYRTGDLARYRPDGAVAFLGRADAQVKLRGHRVELGEIEAVLRAQPEVTDAAALVSDGRLWAWAQTQGDMSGEALRERLRQALPAYMIPGAVMTAASLPRTPSGKIDRRALDRLAPTPLPSAEPPRSAAEQAIASVWAQVLGLERVGLHDNFFELGGDSILAMRVISRCGQLGLDLTPRQLFQHPTPAALALVARARSTSVAALRPARGQIPLTPIQRWFFEGRPADPHHFNQALLLELPATAAPRQLERAFAAVFAHHDALSMRFGHRGDQWTARSPGSGGAVPFAEIDLSALGDADQRAALEAQAAAVQASLDLDQGPIARCVLFSLGAGRSPHLLLVIHHLVVDGVSLRILLDDLTTAYDQLDAGQPIRLPPTSMDYGRWAERLLEHARGEAAARAAAYWRDLPWRSLRPLPVDGPADPGPAAEADTAAVILDAADTAALLRSRGRATTRVEEVMLAALAQTLTRWTGEPVVAIELEGHGREEIFEDVELSRSVGWFTSLYPLLIELDPAAADVEAVASVRDQIRRVPGRGVGYGLMRYLGEGEDARALSLLPTPQIVFNYLGRFDDIASGRALFTPATLAAGPSRSPVQRRRHLLEITAIAIDGVLTLSCTYSPRAHRREAMEALLETFASSLRRLSALPGDAPRDASWTGVDPAQIDALLADPNVEDVYPLSPVQEGMLFHAALAPEATPYFQQVSWVLRGELDASAMRRAWQAVIDRHPALRTSFIGGDLPRPLQVVARSVEVPWHEEDVSGLMPTERVSRLEGYLQADRRAGFTLDHAPLLRLALLSAGPDEHTFVWSHHHALLDGWSLPRVLDQVATSYASILRGAAPALREPRPYRDYIAWLERRSPLADEAFWRSALAGISASTPLPGAREPDGKRRERRSLHLWITAEDTAAIEAMRRRHHITLNTLFVGAWAELLGRHARSRDVLFGVTTAGRPAELRGVEAMIGLFINTLPVRVRRRPEEPAVSWLRALQGWLAEMRQHEHASLVDVQGFSEIPRGAPLFESILVFENYPTEAGGAPQGGLHVASVRAVEHTNYALSVGVVPGAEIGVRMTYDAAVYDEASIRRLLAQIQTLIAGIVRAPELPIGRASLLDDEAARRLSAWNDTATPVPGEAWLPAAFEEQAARRPDATAILCAGETISYGELDRRAEHLARRLRSIGVTRGCNVAIHLSRSIDAVVAILAAVKAGGAYVPLDPAYPASLIALILEDVRPAVVLADDAFTRAHASYLGRVIHVDGAFDFTAVQYAEKSGRSAAPEDPAYVIYTSGSTGAPKGVMVSHRAAHNRLAWSQSAYPLGEGDRVLHSAPLAFDFSVWELFAPLSVGARLVLATEDQRGDVVSLVNLIEAHGVTCIHFVPSMLEVFLEHADLGRCRSLRIVLSGGEPLPTRLQDRALSSLGAAFYNQYGPTEATIDATWWRCARQLGQRRVPIGRPIANTQVHLLDAELAPLPVGAIGEIFIGGAGVAIGYWARPGLTAERFLPDPFSRADGARMFRTGDLGRRLPSGAIEIVGRADDQLKIRGHRIEPAQIVVALRVCPGVRDAVVTARGEGAFRQLVAHVVLDGAAAPTRGNLRRHLAERLPEPMIPSVFIPIAALPRTPSGKLDRRALEALEVAPLLPEAPRRRAIGEIEETIATLWSDALGVASIGRSDDFFGLGGHSLMAARIVARVASAFGVEISLRAFLDHPTVAGMATLLSAPRRGSGPPLASSARDRIAPPTLTQEHILRVDQALRGLPLFNLPYSIPLRCAVDAEVLASALAVIVARHEILRTSFPSQGGCPVQFVAPVSDYSLDVSDLSELPADEREIGLRALEGREALTPLDLTRAPGFRARLVRLEAERHVVLVTLHHAIVDAWSVEILEREIRAAYAALRDGRAIALEALPLQFADYAIWQRAWLASAEAEADLRYWVDRLGGDLPLLELPGQRPRPAAMTLTVATVRARLDIAARDALRSAGRREGATLFMTLLAALKAVLASASGQADIRVGTLVVNRHRPETAALVGLFVNTLVLRTEISPGLSFRAILGRVRGVVLDAYRRQELPFEVILERLEKDQGTDRSRLFQILFVMNGDGFGPAPTASSDRVAPTSFDLIVTAAEDADGLALSFLYKKALFEPATMEGLLETYRRLLCRAAAAPRETIARLIGESQ